MGSFIKNLIIKNSKKKGFTLLEIMLVTAAIGILASIVIVAINPLKQIGKAENAARWGGINAIQKALDQYNIANGRYPEEIVSGRYEEICDTGEETELEPITDCTDKVDLRELVPTYIAEIPRDPEGGGYRIGINPVNGSISIWADKAGLGELVAINPLEIELVINGTNQVGETLTIDPILNGLGSIDPNNIVWYRGTTQVGTGTSYTVQPDDATFEIIAEVVLGGTSIANGTKGITPSPIVLSSGDMDPNFDIGTGIFGSAIWDQVVQSDGKIIVGGNFTNYQGINANGIIRLNSDGSRDTSFDMGIAFGQHKVNVIKLSNNDSKITLGGGFSSYQGVSANKIIRLNSDGSRDTSFDMGTGFSGGTSSSEVRYIEIQGDGNIVSGGEFTNYQGGSANRIVRLNADGSRDTSFNIGTGFNNIVWSLKIQSDGKVLIGGIFTSYQGLGANRIIRLNTNGSKDTSFDIGTGFNDGVYNVETQIDGKVLVGGLFTNYKGDLSAKLVRLIP